MKNFAISFYAFFILLLIGCGGGDNCIVEDILVETADCSCETVYELTLDFSYQDAPSEYFTLYARQNQVIGYYKLTDLPLTIDKFETSGLEYEYIKICLDEEEDCCTEFEFMPADCLEESTCSISDLIVETGECNRDGTYLLELDFNYSNAGNDYFDVFVSNNEIFDTYLLEDLALTIDNFQPRGTEYDYIKICINDNPDCCQEIEFMTPDCEEECSISEIVYEVGNCTSENTYTLYLDLEVSGSTDDSFDVFVSQNEFIGYYQFSDLPLEITDFEMSGEDYDYIKICINDNPGCCKEIEFMSPICEEEECSISEIVYEVGNCTSENTYTLYLDLEVSGSTDDGFDVFARQNEFIGYYQFSDLPLEITNFEMSGEDYDYVKICINDNPDCCKKIEFLPPDC